MKNIVTSIILFSVFLSCTKKEIKSKYGGIDVISNVYFEASKGLDNKNNKTFYVSKINYSNDSIIEIIPNIILPNIIDEIYFIKDTLYYNLTDDFSYESNMISLSDIINKQKPMSVFSKAKGGIYLKRFIENYIHRKNINDTILFGKKYKRFEVNSPISYTRYYVYDTDTILPYQIYNHISRDYKGRIERIDSYNKREDVFMTLQMIPRKNMDKEAEEIFKFNQFLQKKNTHE